MSLFTDVLREECLNIAHELLMALTSQKSMIDSHMIYWKRYNSMIKRLDVIAIYLNRITGSEDYEHQLWEYQGMKLPYMSVLEIGRMMWLSKVLLRFRPEDWCFHESIQEMRENESLDIALIFRLKTFILAFAVAEPAAEKCKEPRRFELLIAKPYLDALEAFCVKLASSKSKSFTEYIQRVERLLKFQSDLEARLLEGVGNLGQSLCNSARRILAKHLIKAQESKYQIEFPRLLQADDVAVLTAMFAQLRFAGSALDEDFISGLAPTFEKIMIETGLKNIRSASQSDYMTCLFNLFSKLSSFAGKMLCNGPPAFDTAINTVAKQFVDHMDDKKRLGELLSKFLDQIISENRPDVQYCDEAVRPSCHNILLTRLEKDPCSLGAHRSCIGALSAIASHKTAVF